MLALSKVANLLPVRRPTDLYSLQKGKGETPTTFERIGTAQTNFTDGVELEGDFFSYCDNLLMKEMIYVID